MIPLDQPSVRPPFPADSRARPTCPTACCGRSTSRRSTIAAPSSPRSRKTVLDGHEEGLQDRRRRSSSIRLRHRRVGGGARQHAVAGRPRADVRDRPLRHAVAARWPSGSGSSSSSCPATGGTASIPAAVEAQLADGSRARDQGGDASCTTRRRPASPAAFPAIRAGDRSRRPSGAASWSTRSRSLASIDYRHDEWGVDVTVAGSQKGLMLPPGLSFNAVSDKALAASEDARSCRARTGLGRDARDEPRAATFPYTPATNLLYGLHEALDDAARGRRCRQCSRATSATPRRRGARCAPGASRSCARNPAEYSALADGGDDARGPRRRRVPPRRARALRHVARHGPGQARRAACSASAISASSTT